MKNLKLLTITMLLSLAGISLQAKDVAIVSGNGEDLVQLLLGNTNYTSDNQQPTILSNIKSVPSFQIAVLPKNAIQKLLPTQASAFIEMWTSPDINEINFIEALEKDQVAGLSSTAIVNSLSHLSDKQLGFIVSSQLDASSAAKFTETQIHNLSKSCLKGVSNDVLEVFAPKLDSKIRGNKLTSDQKKLIKDTNYVATA